MKHPDPLDHLDLALADLEARGLRRAPAEPGAADAVSFCSNDYLGLAPLPPPPAPSGAGASRLVSGERAEHQVLEAELASWVGSEAALLFTSGYAANVGALSSLVGPEDLVVSDVLAHASLIDGIRLARGNVRIVPHGDVDAVARELRSRRPRSRAWVVVESYYSMDADTPDLRGLREACDRAGAALIVDEAHALGVMGPRGAGLCAASGVRADVLVGTLGKALGSQGAFAAGRRVLKDWLWNRARSFVFSTGLSPASAAAASRALATVQGRPELARRVISLAERLRRGLVASGVVELTSLGEDAPNRARRDVLLIGHGYVVPIVLGSETRALSLSRLLASRGVVVRAIRPPTVPAGTARLRLTVTARHDEADIDRAIDAFAWALPRLGSDAGRFT